MRQSRAEGRTRKRTWMRDEHRNGLLEEVVEIFDNGGLDTTRVQPLDEVLSGGGISCENLSWRCPEEITFEGQWQGCAEPKADE